MDNLAKRDMELRAAIAEVMRILGQAEDFFEQLRQSQARKREASRNRTPPAFISSASSSRITARSAPIESRRRRVYAVAYAEVEVDRVSVGRETNNTTMSEHRGRSRREQRRDRWIYESGINDAQELLAVGKAPVGRCPTPGLAIRERIHQVMSVLAVALCPTSPVRESVTLPATVSRH
jgi:hypothetical protein